MRACDWISCSSGLQATHAVWYLVSTERLTQQCRQPIQIAHPPASTCHLQARGVVELVVIQRVDDRRQSHGKAGVENAGTAVVDHQCVAVQVLRVIHVRQPLIVALPRLQRSAGVAVAEMEDHLRELRRQRTQHAIHALLDPLQMRAQRHQHMPATVDEGGRRHRRRRRAQLRPDKAHCRRPTLRQLERRDSQSQDALRRIHRLAAIAAIDRRQPASAHLAPIATVQGPFETTREPAHRCMPDTLQGRGRRQQPTKVGGRPIRGFDHARRRHAGPPGNAHRLCGQSCAGQGEVDDHQIRPPLAPALL